MVGLSLRCRWVRCACRCGLAIVAGSIVAATARADLHVRGAWTGTVQPDPRLPEVPWTLALDAAVGGVDDASGTLQFSATVPGGQIRASVARQPGEDGWRWEVPAQTLDVAALQPAAARLLPAILEFGLTDVVTVGGAGSWRQDTAAGRLQLRWTPDQFVWSARQLRLTQPQVQVMVELAANAIAAVRLEITWLDGKVATLPLGPGNLVVSRMGEGPWQVERAEATLWGGRVSLSPWSVDPDHPAVRTTVTIEDVAAGELVRFIPDALSSATGRVAGAVDVAWSPAGGLVPGHGKLQITPAETSVVRLAASPGLLTAQVPGYLQTLPNWLGPLARWTRVKNPALPELVAIELGRRALRVEMLEVELYPDGLNGARSAIATLRARPVDGTQVDEVTFSVNVAGPLQKLLELGMDDRARIHLHP